jgi:hypothetical protein
VLSLVLPIFCQTGLGSARSYTWATTHLRLTAVRAIVEKHCICIPASVLCFAWSCFGLSNSLDTWGVALCLPWQAQTL